MHKDFDFAIDFLINLKQEKLSIRRTLKITDKKFFFLVGVELSLKRTPTVHWRLGATAKVANINLIDELVRELVRDNTKMLGWYL